MSKEKNKEEIVDQFLDSSSKETEYFVQHTLDIAYQVSSLLKSNKLSQNELSKLLGKEKSEISKWLSGNHNLTLKSISKLEAVLKKQIIFTREELLVPQKTSDWLEKAEWEIANEDWLNKSARIAIKILRTIRAKDITQLQLAELLNVSPRHVSKIVQGKENLTLETISKIEKVLNITLFDIPVYQQSENLSAGTNKQSNVADSKIKYHK